MKGLLACLVTCLMSLCFASEERAPALAELDKFVGGVWRTEASSPTKVEFRYMKHPDGKGLMSQGVIGMGTGHPVHVHAMFGWDATAKKVYYLDTHNSDTVYYGHLELSGKDMVFTFGPAGGDMKKYSSMGRFVDDNTYQFVIKQADGNEVVGLTLKRQEK